MPIQRKSFNLFIPLLLAFNLFPQKNLSQTLPSHPVTAGIISFDTSHPPAPPQPLPSHMGGTSPTGHTIGINNRFLTMDGKPWLPVMGEFHYSRYPEAGWEEELLKMKAAGVQIVATYVFWIHHEEIEGQFDWTGQRDLRHFVELCAKHNLFVLVRIGPFAHGEVRNGGLPDWLLAAGATRRNSPEYLGHVRQYFGQIGEQLHGLTWKEDGPIIGLQLENEYFLRGPDAGAAHISTLKQIALASGLDAPLFTVTGWDNPGFPANEVVPVFGVYPDSFWDSTLQAHPPDAAYLFSFPDDPGGPTAALPAGGINADPQAQPYPYLLAEAGGGMQVAYHRRPAISAEDVVAIAITHLGAGANLYGYYMFQGGANPDGKKTTLQESVASDHVYDLPVVSYDFQAPLGQYGELRPSDRALKLLHLFLADFGDRLAPMVAVRPDHSPSGPADMVTPRVALRSDGEHAFLFLNNYVRDYPMAPQKAVQFRVTLAKGSLLVPRKPIDIPSGIYLIWPINFDLNNVSLKYATSQLICFSGQPSDRYYFFFAPPGVPSEFSFDAKTIQSLQVRGGSTLRRGGAIYVSGVHPGTRPAISISGTDGNKTHIILLSAEQAGDLWKDSTGKFHSIVLSKADVFFDDGAIHLRSTHSDQLSFDLFPSTLSAAVADSPLMQKATQDGIFRKYYPAVVPRKVEVTWDLTRRADPSLPVPRGKYNALAPTDSDFARAGVWKLSVPANAMQGLSDLFLQIRYRGDVARFYSGDKLLDDNFYNGAAWMIGLKRILDGTQPRKFDLKIMPLRKDAPVFMPPRAWPDFGAKNEIAEVESITSIPVYEIVANLSD